jgi:periplasmic protein TonB
MWLPRGGTLWCPSTYHTDGNSPQRQVVIHEVVKAPMSGSDDNTVDGTRRGPGWVPPTERADRKWHRALGLALLFAILVHAAILLSVRSSNLPPMTLSAAGPQAGDYRAAAGGGGGMEMVQVRVQEEQAPSEEAVPEPVPVPEVEVEIEPVPQPEPSPSRIPEVAISTPGFGTAGDGGARGEATGPGLADGRGQGGGGTDAEGASGVIAPVPRGMFLPPQGVPSDAKGREITVYVFVTAQGRVVSDSTRIHPATRDARFNRRLRDQAAEWVFEPARRGGQAVAAWFQYGLTL